MHTQTSSRKLAPLFRSFNVKTIVTISSLITALAVTVSAQDSRQPVVRNHVVPKATLIRILKAEDERRWDRELRVLMAESNPAIRERAALATGRIGEEDSIPPLIDLLQDKDLRVRVMATFAIGEVGSEAGAEAMLKILNDAAQPDEMRARTVESLGKIASTLPSEKEVRRRQLGAAILQVLRSESERKTPLNRQVILFGLTAALRARPTEAGPVIAGFLTNRDPRIRADAANSLARLRAKDGNTELRRILKTDVDPVVRANAARVLGATEDKESFDVLLDRAIADPDSRVRVGAIRSLASLKDPRAAEPLIKRGGVLAKNLSNRPPETNEVLEIATTLGRLLPLKEDQNAIAWLQKVREATNNSAPEVELAFVRIGPTTYLSSFGNEAAAKRKVQETILLNWHSAAAIAQGLGEFAALPDSQKNKSELVRSAESLLRAMLDYRNSGLNINTLVAVHSEYAIPDVLRAVAAFKPADLAELLRKQLTESDVVVRGTAADLLGETTGSPENTRALAAALPVAMSDKLSDAVFSILGALGRQKTTEANDAIKAALNSNDHLIRRRAVSLLKANGAGDFSSRIGTVQTQNTMADYQRAVSRIGKRVVAVVTTGKGSFTMELLPGDAPLTVDNFVQLARQGYFRNITFHRVVPNFVIQGGDPRGDGNGGPGHQIRCEINEAVYDRGAVGMALSGKDTGGSQWFVTHSPQPHLDGGYTVFGRVIAGMDVVDRIVRGDAIRSIVIR